MNGSDLCPDDLLLAARQGELGVVDDAKLSFHLERCARCRAALEVGRAFDAALGARVGDDRIATAIAARLTQPRSKRRLAYAVAAGVLLSGSLAGAAANRAALERWFGVPSRVEVKEAERTLPSRASAPDAPAARAAPNPPLELTPAPEADATLAPLQAKRVHPSSSAADLFREANALRGQGQSTEAQARYRQLQAQFPSAAEARVSLVSLGRLELGSKPAEALRHFNAYLTQAGSQTLAEEALFGRASALGRLGRRTAERAAWQELLARFPSSVYAEHAMARLVASP